MLQYTHKWYTDDIVLQYTQPPWNTDNTIFQYIHKWYTDDIVFHYTHKWYTGVNVNKIGYEQCAWMFKRHLPQLLEIFYLQSIVYYSFFYHSFYFMHHYHCYLYFDNDNIVSVIILSDFYWDYLIYLYQWQ